jgi:hypothetical protein
MRAGAIVTGVLGLGTALVFALAALTASMFPNGTIVASGWSPVMERGWVGGGMAVPVPAPVFVAPDVNVGIDGTGGGVVVDGFRALPGDTVVPGGAGGAEIAPAP